MALGDLQEEPSAGKPHARICEGESRMAELLDHPSSRYARRRRPAKCLPINQIHQAQPRYTRRRWPGQMEKLWSPIHFHDRIVPRLREGGASDEQIQALLVDNPRRFFAGEPIPS